MCFQRGNRGSLNFSASRADPPHDARHAAGCGLKNFPITEIVFIQSGDRGGLNFSASRADPPHNARHAAGCGLKNFPITEIVLIQSGDRGGLNFAASGTDPSHDARHTAGGWLDHFPFAEFVLQSRNYVPFFCATKRANAYFNAFLFASCGLHRCPFSERVPVARLIARLRFAAEGTGAMFDQRQIAGRRFFRFPFPKVVRKCRDAFRL